MRTLGLLFLFILASCDLDLDARGDGARTSAISGANLDAGYSYVIEDNPIFLENGNTVSAPFNQVAYLDPIPRFITGYDTLRYDCSFQDNDNVAISTINSCIQGADDDVPEAEDLIRQNAHWYFDANTKDFLQVSSFYHAKNLTERMYEAFQYIGQSIHNNPNANSVLASYPRNVASQSAHWIQNSNGSTEVNVFANCSFDKNAFFSPAELEICLGIDSDINGFSWAQDPTIIYHEMGHLFTYLMMNMRNINPLDSSGVSLTSPNQYRSSLGSVFYDEGGAIEEGIADYFSYVMTERTHIGEWAMGRYYNQSRPLTESDELHLQEVQQSTLSYPTYLNYDPNQSNVAIEDVHYAGQIVSHYFVAMTEQLKSQCRADHQRATNMLLLVLAETLTQIGDLNSRGSDYNIDGDTLYRANYKPAAAFDWVYAVNPPNFRNFFQRFLKNTAYFISDPINGLCSDFSFTEAQDLLDSYGLLLFKTLGDNVARAGNINNTSITVPGIVSAETSTDETLRQNTVLISKDLIDIPDETDTERTVGTIFDDQATMRAVLENLTFQGATVLPSNGLADVSYNNGNNRFSPGEIVGIAPNIINDSNTTMAGVQVLGTDWDHMKNTSSTGLEFQPCQIDGFPLESEGAIQQEVVTGADAGKCNLAEFDQAVGDTAPDGSFQGGVDHYMMPACMVQYSDEDETVWLSQNEYRKKEDINLEDSQCLGSCPEGGFCPACMLRVLPGGNQSYYSQIAPQSTWAETLRDINGEVPTFNTSSILIMELNKWIQPGTIFNCRLRVRFSNCIDCYNDESGNEYRDHEYAGHKPFKVINFKITVID